MAKLEPLRESVGCNHSDVVFEPYNKAYDEYRDMVMMKMEEWIVDRKAELDKEGHLKETEVNTVLNGLENKLWYLLNDFWATDKHRIHFNTAVPIASTAWMKDLNAFLKVDEEWISVVSPTLI